MKISCFFCLLAISLIFNSCDGQHLAKSSDECKMLNNKGSEYLANYPANGSRGLKTAIDFFKKALKCDSTYIPAYLNIAIAYDYGKEYKLELGAYNNALALSNNYPSILTEKGIVFEKLSKLDSAKSAYKSAAKGFRDSLAISPKNINFLHGYLLLLALTEGKQSSLKELDKQIVLQPELSSKMSAEYYFFRAFDKNAYIYHLSK